MANNCTREGFIKRAGTACLACRSRKIRCDVEQSQPCGNCVTDDLECETKKSLRGKKRRKRSKLSRKFSKTASDATQDGAPDTSCDNESKAKVFPTYTKKWLQNVVELESLSQGYSQGTVTEYSSAELDQRFLHQELSYASLVDRGPKSHPLTTDLTPPSLTNSHPTCDSTESSWTNLLRLPEFVRPLPENLTKEDINYLYLTGALDLPSTRFFKALLSSYIQYIYPYLPTTDLANIIGILVGENAEISILLLQAINFAAVTFVDMMEIRLAGFDTRRSCRKAFYDKAKVLYNFDVESDKVTLIQSVLLMANWNETPGDNKGAWHWMGVAISLAQTLGMHRKAESRAHSHESKLYKRIWWSCYFRDRILAIAMGRLLRIRDDEFDTPPLTIEDFDIVDLPHGLENLTMDTEDLTTLAKMCIKAMELCKLVTGVMELHFSVLPTEDSTSRAKENNGTTATMVFIKPFPPEEHLLQWYDEELKIWYSTLPSSCIYGAGSAQGYRSPCVMVNAASLRLTFWAVISALHRPRFEGRQNVISMARVEEAALEVLKVDREMHKTGLDKFLPATGIPFQFPAFITLAQGLKNQKAAGITTTLEFLYYCFKVVETLRKSFVGGDSAIKFLMLVAQKVDIILLLNQDTTISGIAYQGTYYSPENDENSLYSTSSGFEFVEVSSHQDPCESALENDPEMPRTRDIGALNDLVAPSFDQMDAIDWGNLTDILPPWNTDFEFSFGGPVNLGFLQDVEMI